MTVTFLPLYALDLGASIVMVGMIETAKSLGSMLFNLPGGFLVGRSQTRPMLIIGMLGIALAAFLRGISTSPTLLLIAGFTMGISNSVWILTRLTLIRENVPAGMRGRFLANFGGVLRLSRIIGPFTGGVLISHFGYKPLFFLHSGFVLMAVIVIFVLLPVDHVRYSTSTSDSLGHLRDHFLKHRRNILAAMTGITGLTVLRVSRGLILPLWAHHIGVGVTLLGLIISISACVELLLVVPAGWIMDRKGRKWTAVPTTLIMTLAMCLIPLTRTFATLLAVTMLMSLGNGLGSGINMVLGTDLAPRKASGQFLGFWRFFTDGGMAAGPMIVGFVTEIFSLGIAMLAIGGVGVISGLIMICFMDRMKHHTSD